MVTKKHTVTTQAPRQARSASDLAVLRRGYGYVRYAVYPGVTARMLHGGLGWHMAGVITFEGFELDLRRAGLLRPGDRIPEKPRCSSDVATMLLNGELKLLLDREEAAARDKAFARFMREVTAPVALGDDPQSKREPPSAPRDDDAENDDDDDDDWPMT